MMTLAVESTGFHGRGVDNKYFEVGETFSGGERCCRWCYVCILIGPWKAVCNSGICNNSTAVMISEKNFDLLHVLVPLLQIHKAETVV